MAYILQKYFFLKNEYLYILKQINLEIKKTVNKDERFVNAHIIAIAWKQADIFISTFYFIFYQIQFYQA